MMFWILVSVLLGLALVACGLVTYWIRRQRESEDRYGALWYVGHHVVLDSGEIRTITEYNPETATFTVNEDFLMPATRKDRDGRGSESSPV